MSVWKNRPDGKTVRRSALRIDAKFAPHRVDMLESPAFRVLGLAEHKVLARIEIELCHHNGFENGNLIVTYADFAAYGIRRPTDVSTALYVLSALGFVEVKHGRGGNAEFRQPNRLRLTYCHVWRGRFEAPIEPTHEWRRITPEKAQEIAEQARLLKIKSRYPRGKWSRYPRGKRKGGLSDPDEGDFRYPRGKYFLDLGVEAGIADGNLSPVPSPSETSLTPSSSAAIVTFPARKAVP